MGKKKSLPPPKTSAKDTPQTRADLPVEKTSKPKRRGTLQRAPTKNQQSKDKSFPIVGIGASAGGLDAFTHLLKSLSPNTGMAFVLVQHLDPKHESKLTELLSRATKMPVTEVTDDTRVEPDHVYVIPPNMNMAILHGVLNLMPRTETRGQHMPIDYFLRSLAEDHRGKTIGVILSGNASDGTLGLKAIKAEGGITFAQDEKSAKYDGMPSSAIAAGVVDFILPPEGIAKELARIGRHPYVTYSKAVKDELLPKEESDLNKIFILLRTATGVDFTYYKHTTIKRRIKRRMVLHKMEKLGDYVKYLQNNPAEVEALYQDILISVTGFFREPETFEALKSKVFPSIMKNRAPDEPIRVWVPGCSTGEEVYSIAISLLEFLGNMATNTPIQIFATDISEKAIEKARAGIYMESAMVDVSPERLRRFFVKVKDGYQISKTIREMCVFAKQNMTKDPPFSKLDLISCRNVLIYLGQVLQKKVMPIFHYALKPTGFLALGTSETIGTFSDMFVLVDRKHRVYSKKPTPARLNFNFVASDYMVEKADISKGMKEEVWSGLDVQKEADRIVLSKYAPAGAIINDGMEILQFRGHTGPYLEPAPGEASFNLLKMAREGLFLGLRTVIQKVKKENIPVQKKGLQVKYNGEFRDVNVEAIPIKAPSSKERYFLVLFEDVTPPGEPKPKETKPEGVKPGKVKQRTEARQIIQLKQELATTKEYLQTIIEEQEATNEELKSANEEILSSNEELQSTNEELETAKEELQSTNEELTTVNEELQNRNLELSQVTSDLVNLLSSANIPIVMLGNDLCIRRFTPTAERVLNLIPTDVRRPISDIKPNINVPDLEGLILDVIDTVTVKEREVQDREGRWYSMQIRPYKTMENKTDGAVIALVDIDELKHSLEQVKESRDYAQAIVETVREPLVVLDANLRVKTANQAFYQTFQVSKEKTENQFIYDLGTGQWNIPRLRTLLEEILPENIHLQGFEVDHEFPRIGRKTMLLNARQIYNRNNGTELILLAIEDINERKQAEEQIKASLKEKEVLLKEIHHRVKNNLQVISSLLNLQSQYSKDKHALEIFNEIQNRVQSMALIHDKLYQSKDLAKIDFAEYTRTLVDSLFRSYGINSDAITLRISADDVLLDVNTAITCGLIINELLSNSLKHAFPKDRKGEIRVELRSDKDHKFTLIVSDNGVGFPKDLDLRNMESLGLQLVIALTDQLGGTIRLNRRHGTAFKVTFSPSPDLRSPSSFVEVERGSLDETQH